MTAGRHIAAALRALASLVADTGKYCLALTSNQATEKGGDIPCKGDERGTSQQASALGWPALGTALPGLIRPAGRGGFIEQRALLNPGRLGTETHPIRLFDGCHQLPGRHL